MLSLEQGSLRVLLLCRGDRARPSCAASYLCGATIARHPIAATGEGDYSPSPPMGAPPLWEKDTWMVVS